MHKKTYRNFPAVYLSSGQNLFLLTKIKIIKICYFKINVNRYNNYNKKCILNSVSFTKITLIQFAVAAFNQISKIKKIANNN